MSRPPSPTRLAFLLARSAVLGAAVLSAVMPSMADTAGAAKHPHKKLKGPLPSASAPAATTLTPAWEVLVPDTSVPYLGAMESGFVVVTRGGALSAHALGASETLWRLDVGSSLDAAPLLTASRLILATRTGDSIELVLIDTTTGRIVSRQPGGNATPLLSSLPAGIAVADPTAGAPSLTVIDPETGAVRWKTSLPAAPSAGAAQCAEALLVGGADGTLTSLGASDGSIRWTEKIGEAITTPALCDGKRAWVGSADNRLHALRIGRRGCGRRWSYLTGGDISGRIMEYGSRVLFFSYDTYLYALEAGNGHLAWKVRMGRRPQVDSVVIDDLLMVAPLNAERLEAFHLPDGAQTATLTLSGGKERFVTPPARAGHLVLIAAARYGEESARIIALDPAGSPRSTASSTPSDSAGTTPAKPPR